MKDTGKKSIIFIGFFVLLLIIVNKMLIKWSTSFGDKKYKVSINRLTHELAEFENEKGRGATSLEELYDFTDNEYDDIESLEIINYELNFKAAYEALEVSSNEKFEIVIAGNCCYKINYVSKSEIPGNVIFLINFIIVLSAVFTVSIYLYFYFTRVRPYNIVSTLPLELARGNLTIPLKEDKNKTFGKFIWGLDLLREKLEENKKKELELQKEKKLLLMSLSHDIKTPLSAINLYATALERNLYDDEGKRKDIAIHISEKSGEIEKYINDIVKASNEDFLHFEVNVSSCYTKDIIDEIENYYKEKMQLNLIEFSIDFIKNMIIIADKDRLIEVIQNIIENAIKYGDGKFIKLRTYREEDEYHFQILNSGCELEDKELTSIFNSFFRGSNVKSKEGSGLGLYICRELMHLMQGEVFAFIKEEEGVRCLLVDVVARVA